MDSKSSTRRHILAAPLLLGLFCMGQLRAQNKNTQADPGRIKRLQPYLQTPNLIGQGKYTYWGFDVYEASLWATEPALNAEKWQTQRIALELHYLRDFKGLDIAKRSIDEIHAQSPLAKSQSNAWLKALEDIFPNVSKGQTLTGIYIPNTGVVFLYDNALQGEVKDLELAKRFFDIWLSPQTSAPELRKRLFAGT